MALTKHQFVISEKKAEDFNLLSIDGTHVSLKEIRGENGTLIMFICNHCPYVKAIIKDLVNDCKSMKKIELIQSLLCLMIRLIIQRTPLKI